MAALGIRIQGNDYNVKAYVPLHLAAGDDDADAVVTVAEQMNKNSNHT